MNRKQASTLTRLRDAIEDCRLAGIELAGMGVVGTQRFVLGMPGAESLDAVLINAVQDRGETLLGEAEQKLLSRDILWTFRPWGPLGMKVCWRGEQSRAWWSGPALKRDNQLAEQGGRVFRIDFVTRQVFEVLA